MEQTLTLLIRMFVVALVGVSVWLVLDATSNKMASRIFNRAEPVVESEHQPLASPDEISSVPLIGGLLAVLASSVSIEYFFYRRFQTAIQQIESLGGSVRFEPHSDAKYSCFRFGNPSVDLPKRDVHDANFPLLRWLPRLSSLRVCGTSIGEKALKEISRCKSLRSLDLSNNSVTVEQLAVLNRLPSLENLLVETDVK